MVNSYYKYESLAFLQSCPFIFTRSYVRKINIPQVSYFSDSWKVNSCYYMSPWLDISHVEEYLSCQINTLFNMCLLCLLFNPGVISRLRFSPSVKIIYTGEVKSYSTNPNVFNINYLMH